MALLFSPTAAASSAHSSLTASSATASPHKLPRPLQPQHGDPSQASLTKGGTSGGISPQDSLPGNPWGCFGQSDNPHLSGHNPGYVSAIGHTDCTTAPPNSYTTANLFRQDYCIVALCHWTLVGTDEQTDSFNAHTRAIPNHLCSDSSSHLYEIDTYHQVDDGTNIYYTYTGETSNRRLRLRACYEPPINLSSLGSKRQMKAAKWSPAKVAGRRS